MTPTQTPANHSHHDRPGHGPALGDDSNLAEFLNLDGVLVVTEVAGVTTYDPADLGTGRAGFGERIVGALAAHGYPVTADWTIALAEAGFAPVERHAYTFTASARTTDGARYLALQLTMSLARLTEDLSADDLTALDDAITALVAGTSEVVMTSGRFSWIAVRPITTGSNQHDTGAPGDSR
ncbi:hypothetical protein E3T35_13490 [Cryobacterium sp. TMT1-2-2]|uniref:hypothetical protein n=1 Tax=Cryobacterium sp. TMT1-2-2 TaxID=1259233 RepID=UPI00106D6286|nr:hypothetical protein [Cryobacterium sp. TMT1-2-2]TFD10010.1 hypothetical protein E3T35_13490 [Cryobacterium sp. TMT1-2-2]